MKKTNYTILSLFAVISVFFACSSDADSFFASDNLVIEDNLIINDYEYIDLSEPMTQEVKVQRLKASAKRMVDNLKIVNGKLSLDHTSAEELRIDKDYFDEMKRLFEQTSDPYILITPKSDVTTLSTGEGELGGSPAAVYLYTDLYTAITRFNSEFERNCLWHYLTEKGADLLIDESTWTGIKGYAEKEHGAINPIIDPDDYTSITDTLISFYGNSTYDYALGTATVSFKTNGEAVGLIDRYDFNTGDAIRPEDAELATEIMSAAGMFGTPYNIKYGTKKYESQ